MITQEYLKSIFHYDPETGYFTHLRSTNNRTKVGDRVGSKGGADYLATTVDKKRFKVHRLAWFYVYGVWPENNIDHINGNKTDNRIENLRDVTYIENSRNQKKPKNNTSGIIGVSWDKKKERYYAEIRINYKRVGLGSYKSIFEAACARKSAEIKYNFHDNHGRT